MFEATCVGRGIRVALAESFPRVRGDSARVREVLENLLDNALKFMGNQAEPRVQVGVRHKGPAPVFFVRDNGIGVAASDRERIFGLFTHLRPETEGAGAGLAIAKRIVEAHGGRIWVESEGPGRGAIFCFTLGPAYDAKAPERGDR
jgi:signal transduction histidine kinase